MREPVNECKAQSVLAEFFTQTFAEREQLRIVVPAKRMFNPSSPILHLESTQVAHEEIWCMLGQYRGVARGGKGGNPPETEKIVVEKLCTFRRIYF